MKYYPNFIEVHSKSIGYFLALFRILTVFTQQFITNKKSLLLAEFNFENVKESRA